MNILKKAKIIWAFDPTHDPKDAQNIIKELNIWSEKMNCHVLPVCVFSRSSYNFPDVTLPWDKKYDDLAAKSINSYLKETQVKNFLSPEIIFVNTFSHRSMAAELAQYAEKNKALMIFANTHAKKTSAFLRIGGFAETLIATSRVPVLLLNPKAKASKKMSPILFPTDFSIESQNALFRLKSWVKHFHSRIILFNQIENPSFFALGPVSLSLAELSWNKLKQSIRKSRLQKAQELKHKLQNENINCSSLVQHQNKTLYAEILEVAKKKKVGLIAMASQRGPVGQIILGSAVRDVLLGARCPVIIFYRPRRVKQLETSLQQNHYRKLNSNAVETAHL